MIRNLAPILLSITGLLLAADTATQTWVPQKVQVSHTDLLTLPTGGILRLQHTFGEAGIEGWDRPEVEITIIKTTKAYYRPEDRAKATAELDRVHLTAAIEGKDVVVASSYPHRNFPPSLPWTEAPIDVEYRIKAPMAAAMAVQHGTGEVNFYNVSGDIQANVRNGGITLDLAPESQYAVDARSDWGDVVSDFSGKPHRRFWMIGHQFTGPSAGAHQLFLRASYGDIVILKAWRPEASH